MATERKSDCSISIEMPGCRFGKLHRELAALGSESTFKGAIEKKFSRDFVLEKKFLKYQCSKIHKNKSLTLPHFNSLIFIALYFDLTWLHKRKKD